MRLVGVTLLTLVVDHARHVRVRHRRRRRRRLSASRHGRASQHGRHGRGLASCRLRLCRTFLRLSDRRRRIFHGRKNDRTGRGLCDADDDRTRQHAPAGGLLRWVRRLTSRPSCPASTRPPSASRSSRSTTILGVLHIRTNAWVTGIFLALELLALVVLAVLGFTHVQRPLSELDPPGSTQRRVRCTQHRSP